MVAQEYAIHYPERTLTLTTAMSSGNITDRDLPGVRLRCIFQLVRNSVRYGIFPTERNALKRSVMVRYILRGDAMYDIDVRGICQQVLYNMRERRGYNLRASRQQQDAVLRSGSRYGELSQLDVPVLIIHGVNDPFIPPGHSEKLASVIPGSKIIRIDNMGHDVPPYLFDSLTSILVEHFESQSR